MKNALKIATILSGGGGFSLPYTFDPSAESDGPLPDPWEATTFSISSGVIVNTPGIGSNVLTDPGLEAAYTDGKCATLTKIGSPTLLEITSGQHEGSKAQSFTATAQNNALYQSVGNKAPGWWRYYRYARRTAGSTSTAKIRILPSGGTVLPTTSGSSQEDFVVESSWTKKQVSCLVVASSTLVAYLVDGGVSAWSTVEEDDGYFGQLTTSDLFALLPEASRSATVKIVPGSYVDGTWFGMVAWHDGDDSYLMALLQPNAVNANYAATLIKVVNGTATSLIAPTNVTYSAGAYFEIRPVDNDTVGLYYNNTQVGTNQDVADVPGSRAGLIITGGNAVQSFFQG